MAYNYNVYLIIILNSTVQYLVVDNICYNDIKIVFEKIVSHKIMLNYNTVTLYITQS